MKDERTKQFAYSFHTAADRNGFVLGTAVTPGNVHDSHMLEPMVQQVIERIGKPLAVAADAAYKTPFIARFLITNRIKPALPYTRPRTKKGYLKKTAYVYDMELDCYTCPEGQILAYSTTTKEGYRQYKSNPARCVDCPLLQQCTQSENHQKMVQRHMWAGFVEQADTPRLTSEVREI